MSKVRAVDTKNLPQVSFVGPRRELFEKLWEEQKAHFLTQSQPINVVLPNGSSIEAKSWTTTPIEIAASISKSLAEKAIVAKVNGDLWDMGRPLEFDCTLEILDFEEEDAKKVFWHSSSHVLGYSMERYLGCKMNIGPPLEGGGFFYEADTDGRVVSETDYAALKEICKELVSQKQPFQRLICAKSDALAMFEYSPYKSQLLRDKVPEGGYCSVYRCGDFIDPCKGPHIVNTSKVKALTVTKNSSSYWQGKADQTSLQRIYGMAFPSETLMKDWETHMMMVQQNDHRNVGKQQSLWMFHEYAPGCGFFLPHGARIYNALVEFIRKQYRNRGFEEVITPNLFHRKLWETSGHWDHYSENMFKVEIEKEIHSLKPMNCPGHMLMFASTSRSYRELPIRFADFGVLHRNELSGTLSGLTRVRRFQQDDAHIFLRPDQIGDEIKRCLDFVDYVYEVFHFQYYLNLSTRDPEKFIGSQEMWDDAEERLAAGMNEFCNIPPRFTEIEGEEEVRYDGTPAVIKKLKRAVESGRYPPPRQYWLLNPSDAAFYGPKIDIQVEDCMKRKHQCATIQLDFNLPESFHLTYVMSEDEKKRREETGHQGAEGVAAYARPVVIHRAVLGSVERILAVLTEHYGGKWPLWLSPRQICVIPLSHDQDDYAHEVRKAFHDEGFHVDADLSDATFNKKVRTAQVAQYNFILVCGKQEVSSHTVSIRSRDNQQHGEKSIPDTLKWLKEVKESCNSQY